jgi:DNA polymerase III beta subunit, central domain
MNTLTLPYGAASVLMKVLRPFVSTDFGRPPLTRAMLCAHEDKLRCYATDSYRMIRVDVNTPCTWDSPVCNMLPVAWVQNMMRSIRERSYPICCEWDDDTITFITTNARHSYEMDGTFPSRVSLDAIVNGPRNGQPDVDVWMNADTIKPIIDMAVRTRIKLHGTTALKTVIADFDVVENQLGMSGCMAAMPVRVEKG